MDTFPLERLSGFANDLPPYRKPVEAAYRIGAMWNTDGTIYGFRSIGTTVKLKLRRRTDCGCKPYCLKFCCVCILLKLIIVVLVTWV